MDSWSWGPVFEDRRRIILSSYEPGKAWEGNVRVHLWIYDLEEDRLLEEIALKERPAPFMGCTHILPGEDRLVTNPIIDGKQRIWTMDLDGSDPREITGRGGRIRLLRADQPGRPQVRLSFHHAGRPGQLLHIRIGPGRRETVWKSLGRKGTCTSVPCGRRTGSG